MARPERTFRPADLEEDAPPPYAATAPVSDSTVPNPQQYEQSYPTLDTSYIVQQQQQQQQLQQQLSVGLPSTPPPPIHYYPAMSSSAPATGHTTGSMMTTTVAPPSLQYPHYPVISTAVGVTAVGVSPYPMYPGASQSTVYPAPQAYPVMGGGHPSPYGPTATSAGPEAPAAHTHAHAHGGSGSAYPVPYPSATGMPLPSHHDGSQFPQYQYYPAPPLQFAPPPTAATGSPSASTATVSTSTTASPHFSPSAAHVVAPPPHPQQQQPMLVSSTPNVAATTPTVQPTAPEEKLINLDDINGRWEQPEPSRVPYTYTSPVLPPMSAIAVLSPTPAPTPASGVPQTGVATSLAAPLPYVPPSVPQQVPPPATLPDLVTLYKCRKCGATLDSDTAVCKRIHVGGFSGDKQANQATEADLNERRKLILHANGSGAGVVPNSGSSSTVGSQGSTELAVHDSNHGTSDVYLNHRQYNRSRGSEELAQPAHIVRPPALVESSSLGGELGRATSMVNPPSSHKYHSTPSTNDNHGTNDLYIRRSFSTQNPVTSLKKLWRDTKKELLPIQQPPYSSSNHELVAPPPLPPPTMMQQQPYPQPPEQYRPSPLYHHHHPGAVLQQQHHGHVGYPVMGSSTIPVTNSTIPTTASTNPFGDPRTPAYNPAHTPVYIPELPMRQQQQQQQSLPAPSAPPPSHPW